MINTFNSAAQTLLLFSMLFLLLLICCRNLWAMVCRFSIMIDCSGFGEQIVLMCARNQVDISAIIYTPETKEFSYWFRGNDAGRLRVLSSASVIKSGQPCYTTACDFNTSVTRNELIIIYIAAMYLRPPFSLASHLTLDRCRSPLLATRWHLLSESLDGKPGPRWPRMTEKSGDAARATEV